MQTHCRGNTLRIISGGQTGADRAALDWAIRHGIEHGGWCPHDRSAEDGLIPERYQLKPLADGGYRQRTRRNVVDSDGTLIFNLGSLDGGSLATRIFAEKLGKPHRAIQLDEDLQNLNLQIADWLVENNIREINIAGPRESKRPGIYMATIAALDRIFFGLLDQSAPSP